ncbi:barstar family protein [Parvibium lacunae]|nr:barstar family protein [Parvibium lacunae]
MSTSHTIPTKHDYSALSALPLTLLEPLGERPLAGLKQAALAGQQQWLYADLSKCRSLSAILHRLQDLFRLPADFGHNLDALYDSLLDIPAPVPAPGLTPGFVVVLESILSAVPKTDRQALLAVFEQVAADFAARGVAYRLYYSQADQD